ncbi:MAG: hypothetical protein EBR02_05810 [Alphaproteobacteria bacterium]|nr:hypothetical protein [Alphaproteobacteria bacterium]
MQETLNLFAKNHVLEAAREYTGKLQALSEDMLENHRQALENDAAQIKTELRTLHKADRTPVIERQIELLQKERGTIYTARKTLEDQAEDTLANLEEEKAKVVAELNDTTKRMTNRNGSLDLRLVENAYRGSRDDTKKYYEPLDNWYALGNEFAINQGEPFERAVNLALIPKPILDAKWRFMLALADTAFDFNIMHSNAEQLDDNNLILLSSLYARLSQHERGSDNPHMPETHKLRHNPAIHSLHVATLSYIIFKKTRENINGGMKPEIETEWKKLRDDVMLSALVHDCGEMDGELSQGSNKATMTPADAKKFEEERNHAERRTFEKHLDKRCALLHDVGSDSADKPIKEADWQKIRSSYISAFELAEDSKTFPGRLIKALERMQSQHDYLRFEGKNGARLMKESDLANTCFSINYVKRVIDGNAYQFRIGTETFTEEQISDLASTAKLTAPTATKRAEDIRNARDEYTRIKDIQVKYGVQLVEPKDKGDNSLESMARQESGGKKALYTAISKAVTEEYQHMRKQLLAAYGVRLSGLAPDNFLDKGTNTGTPG